MNFVNIDIPSGGTRLWDFTQSLTEKITRSIQIMFLGSKARLVSRAIKLATICELIVCYGDNLLFYFLLHAENVLGNMFCVHIGNKWFCLPRIPGQGKTLSCSCV
jgi:hypothetical protein